MINSFRFIDWIMCLPEELDRHFSDTISQLEEEKKMPYVTSVERLGIKKGIVQGMEMGRQEGMKIALQETICDVLKLRFGKVSKGVSSVIQKIQDSDTLKTLHQKAVFCESLKAFQAELKNVMAVRSN
ncbi:hypothetical protein, partial [Desulfatirhabdium butyrativorans]|uniref:hypothetical protein n=1 Tax=Desulfatirhabdium butyrativorans TaxID=340467 RepID=UPI00054D04E7